MKLLGAGFLWTSLICAGAVYSIKLKKRVTLLEKTLLMLEEMKVLLQYLNMPLNEILKTLCEKDYLSDFAFLHKCLGELENNIDFPVAWKSSFENTVHLYKSDETERLLHLGRNLGTSNIDNQLKMLNLQTAYFEEFLQRAKISYKRYGNTVMTVCALSGCMIFILII